MKTAPELSNSYWPDFTNFHIKRGVSVLDQARVMQLRMQQSVSQHRFM